MDNEIWLPVVGQEGFYEVSNFGRVRSLFFKNGVVFKLRTIPKVLKTFTSKQRRVHAPLWGKWKTVHRLVAMAFIPNPNDKPEVNHKDGNPGNNLADNLEWCTSSENKRHAFATGLKRQSTAKFDSTFIATVRRELATHTGTQRALAAKLGIRPQELCKIKHGSIYMHY